MMRNKILFLYTEIAQYFLACCDELIKQNIDVYIVRYPINTEAPFAFKINEKISVYEKNKYSNKQLIELVSLISPDIIVCSGWTDKLYLEICKKNKKTSVTVLTMDNHWTGNFKQKIATLLSPFYLLNTFSNCWVPGNMQEKYAIKLGFKKENIIKGFYSCDFDLFYNNYLSQIKEKKENHPKCFIFVGRYYYFKGIKDLWDAFIQIQEESPNEWELWCLGTGDIKPIVHPKIKHFGFIQPKDLPNFMNQTTVFVLPSHFEPWGVVVHEFAASGFPIISSDKVGANEAFVENNKNGFIFKSGNVKDLKEKLLRVINLTREELFKMGENSIDLAKKNTPSIWANQIINLRK